MRVVRYWVRSVDCRGRVLTRGGWSVWEVLADETGREFGGKCVAEAQTKREAKDVAARLNARLRGRRNASIRERRARGTKTGRFPGSMRLTKKRIKKRRMATPTYQEAISGLRGLSRKRMKEMKYGRSVLNAPRVKGRKVKGGRAVSLRNFTGTIVRKSDGTVNILGRGRKR